MRMGRIGAEASLPYLNSDMPRVRAAVLHIIEQLKLGNACNLVLGLLKDGNCLVREGAMRCLSSLTCRIAESDKAGVADGIVACFKEENALMREMALESLRGLGAESLLQHLDSCTGMLMDKESNVRVACIKAMRIVSESYKEIDSEEIASNVSLCLKDIDIEVRVEALKTMSFMGQNSAAYATNMGVCLDDESALVRKEAIKTLALMANRASVSGTNHNLS